MSNTLDDRLCNAKDALEKVEALLNLGTALRPKTKEQFSQIAQLGKRLDHGKQLLEARNAARVLLSDLEKNVDSNDCVPYGKSPVKFQFARLLGVDAYLAAQWALADVLVASAGQVLCVRNTLNDPKNAPRLASHFVVDKSRDSKSAAIVYNSLSESFGWPIAISYALRNHFLHDGASDGFFEGMSAPAAFKLSKTGWDRIEKRATETADKTQSRFSESWPWSEGNDLRTILDSCAREMDEALGVLVGSACQTAVAHVAFMLGVD